MDHSVFSYGGKFYGGEYFSYKLLFIEVNLLLIGNFDHCIANLAFLTCNFVRSSRLQWPIILLCNHISV